MDLFKRKKKKKYASSQVELIDIDKGSFDDCGSTNSYQENVHRQQRQFAMEEDMIHLCYGLSDSTQVFRNSIDKWLQELDKYIENYGRLLYSSISNYIYGLDEEKYAIFELNIYSVFDHVMSQDSSGSQHADIKHASHRRIVMKFYDHVNLAHRQFVLYSQKQTDIESLIEKKIAPELARSSKELTSQLIGLVAIFTALSFIVFGGVSSLDSLFSALSQNDNSILPVVIVAIAWAFCLLNLLFAFMYFVLRLTGNKPNISTNDVSIVKQYPMVFISNYVLLSAFLIFLGAWAAQKTGVGRGIYDWVLAHGDVCFVVFFVIVLVVILLLGRQLFRIYRKPKKEQHTQK